ncbi:PX domain-containing protein EREX isoform X2 [Cornus florida]|uniref:PX domain-containing protein EREX isoform X2 n=1 Tax=Cornus florida TaxID=4283 RepID=UPI0028A2447A|nr:PX domain-containing protein EREX isoform X2 [Cornus florida]
MWFETFFFFFFSLSLSPHRSLPIPQERRCCLENWMEELLSDIDLSRSAPVAIFLELEASARSFYDSNQQVSDVNSSASNMALAYQFQPSSDVYLFGGSSSIASDFGHTSTYEISELGTPSHGRDVYSELGMENTASDQELAGTIEATINDKLSSNVNGQFMGGFIQANQERFSRHKMHFKRDNSAVDRYRVNENSSHTEFHNEDEMELLYEPENHKFRSHVRRLSTGSVGSDVSSVRASETSNSVLANSVCDYSLDLPEGVEASRTVNLLGVSDLQFPSDLLVALPSDERHKMNRVLITMQRRLATAKTDMEDLIARLNQEVAVRQFLTTKVKDLEVELETTKQSGKENLQQAVLIERERFTRMQWDMEELRRKCMEMELNLKSEQDEKVRIESTKVSIIQENDVLQKDLDVAREQLENLQKYFEELELKSKADLKLLVKEVKSLRSSQTDLKQELNRLLKEKLEVERVMQKEKQIGEHANAANAKLLHECEILRNRLEECSVNFLIEEEDKLIMDTSSPSDAIDLLITSDNRIGLLLAEAQLLAQDVESAAAAAAAAAAANSNINGGSVRTRDDDLRKMLADVFVDNARLRKQVNSIVRCALNTPDRSEKDDEEETPPRKTVLSKFLER